MKKILVTEDNDFIRENLSEILELAGYKVVTARNGIEGIQKAQVMLPDLIISDIQMPEADGYYFLQSIRAQASLLITPFIFLTVLSEKKEISKGLEMGASNYLLKPFEGDELLQLVASCFNKSPVAVSNALQKPVSW